jgi:tetratricopeptide (TPR) repeat protein
MVVDIVSLDGGQRFSKTKVMDTMMRNSRLYQGYAAYYDNKLEEAIPLLEASKNDPLVKDVNVYQMLADIYTKNNQLDKAEATFTAARALYPDNKSLINDEINFYIRTDKQDKLLAKLEDAVAKDPKNVELISILAGTYETMANPVDKAGKPLPKPANSAEMLAKSESTYQAALKQDPENAELNYYIAGSTYNKGVIVNEQINAITGTTAADDKKVEQLTIEKNKYFDAAIPYFEKAITNYDSKGFAGLTNQNKNNYISALTVLKEIYARKSNMEKVKALKDRIEQVKPK